MLFGNILVLGLTYVIPIINSINVHKRITIKAQHVTKIVIEVNFSENVTLETP